MVRLSGLLLLSHIVIAAQQSVFDISFSAIPLDQALNDFSRTVEQTILYDPAVVQNYQIAPVAGRYSASELMELLLTDTSLCAEEVDLGWLIKVCEKEVVKAEVAQPILKEVSNTASFISEEIIVTGFRNSLIKAREIKRVTVISQDSILAEDIADFPDLNLADSLQRIPGVSITREAGEGRQISLRGLGPDFTTVKINGVEAMGMTSSPMDARGAVSRTRAFDFNIFSSELFNRIDVQKSYSAQMAEGGIGGTVALYTPRPLDFKTPTTVLSYRQGYNSNSEEYDPRIAMMYAHQWQDWGALASLTYSQRATMEYGTNTTRWRQERKNYVGSENAALAQQLNAGDFWFPRGHRYSVWNNQQQRLGLTAALQFQPSEQLNSTLNLFYSKLENDLDEHHLAVKENNHVKAIEWRDNGGDKEVMYAQYQGATWRAETREDFNSSEYQQVSLDTQWQPNSRLKFDFLLGLNSADYQQPQLNKVNINAEGVDIVTDFRDDAFYGVSYSPGFDVTDASAFTVKDLYFQENYVATDMFNINLDLSYQLQSSVIIDAGISYKSLKNEGHNRMQGGFPTQLQPPQQANNTFLPPALTQVYTQHPDYNWLQGDFTGLHQHYGLENYRLGEEAIIDSSYYAIEEQTSAAYALLDFETTLFDHTLTHNLGARWYNTRLISEGFSKGTYTQIVRDYNDWLPSYNLVLDVTDSMLWRFGASKNITRPAISSLSFSADVSQASREEGDIGTILIGNPYLEPFKSTNLDSAFEWYFEDHGLFTVALFYKDIKNFVVEKSELLPYNSLGLPAELLQPSDVMTDLFYVSQPVNADSSTIRGYELVFSRDLDFLPKPFNQFGVIANFTWADGKTLYRDVQGSGEDQLKTFAGLSGQSYNFTLYYEADKWSARVSSAYRSDYILAVQSGNTDQDESGYHATTFIDASASYQLTDNLEITLEGLNLTDERQELYSDSNNRAYNTTSSGRSFFLGVTGRF